MRYHFVINPHSGKKRKQRKLFYDIKQAASSLGLDCSIYYTRSPGDGARYIREICADLEKKGISARIYACGGDGTVNEAVNGAYGFENVEIGAVPLGTGNDYIRNYGTAKDFLDIRRQLQGSSVYSDLIAYRGEYMGKVTEAFCVNMFNIGFDCNVVDQTSAVKKIPLIRGSLAYLVSVIIMLVKKKGADIKIIYPDGTEGGGRVLLTAIGNGCYCGGGVKGVPLCRLDDGLMDVSVISDLSRRSFIRLFPAYARGVHVYDEKVKKKGMLKYTKESSLVIESNEGSMRLCTDGEISTQERVEFRAVRNAFRFIVPAVN